MPIPRMQPVESRAIAKIGYDAETAEAFVEFLGGGFYAYRGVSPYLFKALATADSKGTFVNTVIKRYPFRQVNRDRLRPCSTTSASR